METNVGKYAEKLYTSPSFLEGLQLVMELKIGDFFMTALKKSMGLGAPPRRYMQIAGA